MNYLAVILFFFLTSNIFLLLLFRFGVERRLRDSILLFLSYGVGPFIPALIFYGLICLFPSRGNIFYLLVISGLYLILFLFSWQECKSVFELTRNFLVRRVRGVGKLPKFLLILVFVFVGLYAIQLFVFPVIDVDSAFYLKQSEAFYKFKNLGWSKATSVILDSGDNYTYNYSVRPGIPLLTSLIYLFKGSTDYFTFRFIIFYYYILLFAFFIYLISNLAKLYDSKYHKLSITYGIISFLFFWSLARILIYSYKEAIIYFLALLSIYLAILLLKEKKKIGWSPAVLLAIVLGINSFINFHGIVIECILLVVIFLFLRRKITYKISLPFLIFLLSIPFGCFELFQNLSFLIVGLQGLFGIKITNLVQKYSASADLEKTHYQVSDTLSLYLRGKLQFLTSVGVYGFNFWLFLVSLGRYFKKVWNSLELRVILVFQFIYFFVVTDPFNLNKHPLAVILDVSSKYPTFIVLLGMIITCVFLPQLVETLARFLRKNAKLVVSIFSLILVGVYLVRTKVINILTTLLLRFVWVVHDVDFYHAAVEKFFYAMLLIFFVAILVLAYAFYTKKRGIYFSLVNIVVSMIIVIPFFVTNVGKVPLIDSFSFVGKSQRAVIESIIHEGDNFKVFFYARDHLPTQTPLCTNLTGLLLYNQGHFIFVYPNANAPCIYWLETSCGEGKISILCSSQICLCNKNKANSNSF